MDSFPSGALMMSANDYSFAGQAYAILNNTSSSANDILDVKDWIKNHSSTYQDFLSTSGYKPTNSVLDLTSNLDSLTKKLGIPNFLTNEKGSDNKDNSNGFVDGAVKSIGKYAIAVLAVIIGLVLLAGSIYLYKGK